MSNDTIIITALKKGASQVITLSTKEISGITFIRFRPYVRLAVVTMCLINACLLATVGGAWLFFWLIISGILIWKVFQEDGAVITTGGIQTLSSNWDSFNNIANAFIQGAENTVVQRSNSPIKEYYYVIAPSNIAMVSSDLIYKNVWLIILAIFMFFSSFLSSDGFNESILYSSFVVAGVGYCLLSCGIEISSIGNNSLFLELWKNQKNTFVQAIQEGMKQRNVYDPSRVARKKA